MKYLVLWCSLNCLFFINTVYSTVTIRPVYSNKEKQAVHFTVKKNNIELSCNVTSDSSDEKVSVEWFKDGTPVAQIKSLETRFTTSNKDSMYNLTINTTDFEDGGNYTCKAVAGSETAEEYIIVASNIAVQIKPDDINVVEGEKLRIVCQVRGTPLPELVWEINTEKTNETLTLSSNSSDNRILILEHKEENGVRVPNGLLVIEDVTKEDRGDYNCVGKSQYFTDQVQKHEAYVRVKDKYAALWPFLGICIEVIVLCTIIIIYEKKRNKTELEESDTDQSPDQKNTPDHGKGANLRHRQ